MTDTIIYDIFGSDDKSYGKLIKLGCVKNEMGEVEIRPVDAEELKMVSVLGIRYVKSGRGYFDAWKSNFQKMIRRGIFNRAVVSFLECAECEGVFLSNIINRLCHTIVCEDIGVANFEAASEATNLLSYYYGNKKEGLTNIVREKVIRLIYIMTEGPKSRLSDNIFCYLKFCGKLEIPKEPIDKLFIKFAWRIKNKNIEESVIYAYNLLKCKESIGTIIGYKKNKLFSRKKKPIYDIWSVLLNYSSDSAVTEYIMNLVKLCELKDGEDTILLINCGIIAVCVDGIKQPEKVTEIDKYDEERRKDTWIEDISYDKHTIIGHRLNRGMNFFFRYGSKLDKLSHDTRIADMDEEYYRKCVSCLT